MSAGDLLRRTKITEIESVDEQQLVVLPSGMSVEDAFKTIVSRGVLCAPVKGEDTGAFIGLVDVKDFVEYVLLVYGKSEAATPSDMYLEKGFSVQSVINLSKNNPFVCLSDDSSVAEALERIVCEGHRLHRVAVLKGEAEVVRMVSQSSLVQFFAQHADELGNVMRKTVAELALGHETQTIPQNESVLDAFAFLHRHGVHGTAVVDEEGKMIGNISETDLKYATDDTDMLVMPLHEYLMQQSDRKVYTCEESDTLADVCNKFLACGKHRLYLLQDGKPLRVISKSDVLAAVHTLLASS